MDPSMIDPSITAAILSTVGAWTWDAVGKGAAARLRGQVDEQVEEFGWRKAAKTYAEELYTQHSTMRVLGKPDPVRLDDVFTDVYILGGASGDKRFPIHELREREFDRFERYLDRGRRKRTAGLELVELGLNLFILGKPGAGKTTFLRHVVLETLRGEVERTPIFISLKRWSTSEHRTLLPYLVEQFAICGFPDAGEFVEQLLSDGKAIVLFDGLDEVNMENDQRRTLVRLLQDFVDQYSGTQVLITCRIAASDYMFEHFSDVEVADFERDQIHAYAEKWFCGDGNGNEEAEETRKAFIKDLYSDENQGIRELCSSPLLLAMLCLAYDETGNFPKRRADLYEDATEVLLRQWDNSRNVPRDEIYKNLTHRRRQQLLSHIAADTFEAGDYFIERRILERKIDDYLRPHANNEEIDPYAVLRGIEVQHGFLIERAHNIYSFSHLTIQEYFAAKYIVDNEARGEVKRLARSHLDDNRWREVYLLAASLLHNADSFLTAMRYSVDTLLHNDERLLHLLQWATKRSIKANVPGNLHPAARLAYVALALDFDVCVNPIWFGQGTKPSRDTHSVLLTVNALTNHLDSTNNLNKARSLACDPCLASDPYRIKALPSYHHHIGRTFGYRLDCDYELLYAWQSAATFASVRNFGDVSSYAQRFPAYFKTVTDWVIRVWDAPLKKRLYGLVMPTEQQKQQAWSVFADGLLDILREERDIGHDWQFSDEQLDNLNTYFAANKLLVDCLDLAYVSDRQAILGGLLAPPA